MNTIQKQPEAENQNKLKNSVLSPSFKAWIQETFIEKTPTCIKSNKAIFICSDRKCKKQNPFICITQECQCIHLHHNCSIRNLKSYLKQLQYKNDVSRQMSEFFETQIDNLIQEISLREDKLGQILQKNQMKRNQYLDRSIKKKLNGQLIYQISQLDNECQTHIQFQVISKYFKHSVKKFQQNTLIPFFSEVQSILFQKVQKVYWSQELKAQDIFIQNNLIAVAQKSHYNTKMVLLQPGVMKFPGPTIKWRVKVYGNSDWLSVGIGLRQSLKKNKFIFNESLNSQCYMISNADSIFAAYDMKRKYTSKNSIKKFEENDIIQIELDKIQNKIRFKNTQTTLSTELDILLTRLPIQDQYHICVGLKYGKAKVELISIQTSLGKYQI